MLFLVLQVDWTPIMEASPRLGNQTNYKLKRFKAKKLRMEFRTARNPMNHQIFTFQLIGSSWWKINYMKFGMREGKLKSFSFYIDRKLLRLPSVLVNYFGAFLIGKWTLLLNKPASRFGVLWRGGYNVMNRLAFWLSAWEFVQLLKTLSAVSPVWGFIKMVTHCIFIALMRKTFSFQIFGAALVSGTQSDSAILNWRCQKHPNTRKLFHSCFRRHTLIIVLFILNFYFPVINYIRWWWWNKN